MPYIYGEWHPTKELRWFIPAAPYGCALPAVLQQKFYCWDDGEKLVRPRREEWRDVPTVTEAANEVLVEGPEITATDVIAREAELLAAMRADPLILPKTQYGAEEAKAAVDDGYDYEWKLPKNVEYHESREWQPVDRDGWPRHLSNWTDEHAETCIAQGLVLMRRWGMRQ